MTHPSEDLIRALVERVVAEMVPVVAPAAAASTPGTTSAVPVAGAGEGGRIVAIGADHGGLVLKGRLADHLRSAGWQVHDCGTESPAACDYPDFAHAVSAEVATGRARVGIVVDGAGLGSCMVANKVPGVRAAVAWDLSSARNGREHNHANVLTLGAGLIGENLAVQIVDAWLATPWGGDRHARRVEKIMHIEQSYLRELRGVAR